MGRTNGRSVDAKIKRLLREITEIDELFYHQGKAGDPDQYAAMLERKRDDIVRAAVLQLHTSIEDIVNKHLMRLILGVNYWKVRTNSARALRSILLGEGSIGFERKLNLAVALKIMSDARKKRLRILNTLRNKCGHHWLLRVPVRRGRRPRQLKPPLLRYEGRDLHSIPVLKDFLAEYGPLHAIMFVEYLG
jgi:hypothetical protein